MLETTHAWLTAIFLPSLTVATAGVVLQTLTRKSSAAPRHTLSIATLGALAIVAAAPFIPVRWTPPTEVQPYIPPPITLKEASPAITTAPATQELPPTPDPIDWLPIVYLAVTGTLLIKGGASAAMATRLKKSSSPTDLPAPYPVRSSSKIEVPLAIGGFRPYILVPETYATWPANHLAAVLHHESAHLKNRDWIWQSLSALTCAIQWFNPFAWQLHRSLRANIEKLADDAVLLNGIPASDYATALIAFSRKPQLVITGALGSPISRSQGIKSRLMSILSPHQPRKQSSTARVLAITAAVTLAVAVLAAAHPSEFAFDNSPQENLKSSIPASRANGYVATLQDGRKLEVLQLSSRDNRGGTMSWKPDGTPISPSKAVKLPTLPGKPWVRAMLIRYEAKKGTTPFDLLVFQKPTDEKGSFHFNYSAGKLLDIRNGYRYGILYFGLSNATSEASFNVHVDDFEQTPVFEWNANGETKVHKPWIKDFKIEKVRGDQIKGEDRFYIRNPKDADKQTFLRISYTQEFPRDYVLIDNTVTGDKSIMNPNFIIRVLTSPSQRVMYLRSEDIKGYLITGSPRLSCSLDQVRLVPNK